MEEKNISSETVATANLCGSQPQPAEQQAKERRGFISRFLRGTPLDPTFLGFHASTLSSEPIQLNEEASKADASGIYPASARRPDDWEEMSERISRARKEVVGSVASEPACAEITQHAPRIEGFLVCYDHHEAGDVIPLRGGRWIVSCEPVTPKENFILVEDRSVSPIHAILDVKNSSSFELRDQLSDEGTSLRKKGSGSGESLGDKAVVVSHGDVVTFGKCAFHVCMLEREST